MTRKAKERRNVYFAMGCADHLARKRLPFRILPKFRLARINKLLISRKPPIPSEETYRVARLMDIPAFLRLGVRDQVQGLHEKTKDGLSEERVDITIGGRPWKKVYFDGAVPCPRYELIQGRCFRSAISLQRIRFEISIRRFHGIPRS